MAGMGPNILVESGKPLFFKVDNPAEVGIEPPANRNGEAVRTWVRALSGFQKEALVANQRTGTVWRLASDEGGYLNGHDAAPCPLAFMSVGMIASYMNEIMALARIRHVAIRNIRLRQENYYTMKGSMQRRTMVGGALPAELTVEIDCDLPEADLHQLVHDAVQASPLNGMMRRELENLFALARNGAQLQPATVAALPGSILPDPGDRFDRATPATAGTTDEFVKANGTTPKKEVAGGTAGAATSLADEQNRTLNLGAVCTLRDDGVKEITHLQYSPHGTSFLYLSDEVAADGSLRAPDAASMISAGLGFCFMTQFGRFASMQKLNLSEYRIIQDTHFSLGGASGGTGKVGEADPVETHVYLTTLESDDVAREMLDVSEKTCFLHALCRSALKPKVKIVAGALA